MDMMLKDLQARSQLPDFSEREKRFYLNLKAPKKADKIYIWKISKNVSYKL